MPAKFQVRARFRKGFAYESMCFVALALAEPAASQIKQGTGEIAGFVGGAFEGGSHRALGVSLGVAATDRLVGVVEFSYMSLGSHVLKPGSFPFLPSVRVGDSRVWNLGAGADVLLARNSKLVPFVSAGVGLLHSSFTGTGGRGGVIASIGYSSNDAAAAFGGGLRYSISRHLGVQPKIVVFTPNRTFVRLSIGIFYCSG